MGHWPYLDDNKHSVSPSCQPGQVFKGGVCYDVSYSASPSYSPSPEPTADIEANKLRRWHEFNELAKIQAIKAANNAKRWSDMARMDYGILIKDPHQGVSYFPEFKLPYPKMDTSKMPMYIMDKEGHVYKWDQSDVPRYVSLREIMINSKSYKKKAVIGDQLTLVGWGFTFPTEDEVDRYRKGNLNSASKEIKKRQELEGAMKDLELKLRELEKIPLWREEDLVTPNIKWK